MALLIAYLGTMMDLWHRKFLGYGAQVYQTLRYIRELRFEHDKAVTEDRRFFVLMDIEAMETSVYFPPGNEHLSQLCDAAPCPPPDIEGSRYIELSREDFPIVPIYPSDLLWETPT